MVELTIPLETGAENAGAMKQIRNAELVDRGTQDCYQATLTTVEVGSRGFIHLPSLSQMDTIVNAIQAIEGSFCTWYK